MLRWRKIMVAVWPGGNGVADVDEVTPRWTGLQLGWMSIRGSSILVCNQLSLSRFGSEYWPKCDWEVKVERMVYYFTHGSGCKVLWWVRLCVCMCVCVSLSVHEDISWTTLAIFTKFFVHVAYGRGSVLHRHCCDMLCTFSFCGWHLVFPIMVV